MPQCGGQQAASHTEETLTLPTVFRSYATPGQGMTASVASQSHSQANTTIQPNYNNMHQNGDMTEEYMNMPSREDGQQPVYHLVTSTHQNSQTYYTNNHQRETSPSTVMSVRKLPKKRKYDPSEIEEPEIGRAHV